MSEFGLDDNVQNPHRNAFPHTQHGQHRSHSLSAANVGHRVNKERRAASEPRALSHSHSYSGQLDQRVGRHTSRRSQVSKDKSDRVDREEKDYYQPTLWWFTSVAFPLIAGTFGPISNLFSICALVQTWRVSKSDGSRVGDPGWLLAFNIVSLVFALLANILLLFNFAKRIPYRIAQPFTIIFWYLSCIFLLIPICITHTVLLPKSPSYALTQSYYYAFIACILYFIISTLLFLNILGSSRFFRAYPPSFAQLSTSQRTLMLQTILFSAYLALGGGIFAAIEGWAFVDAVYWADYTLLTIGLGSDFPVTKTAGRMLLLPYAALGIVFVGLIVSSVRALVLERGRARITRRRLKKERERWEGIIDRSDHKGDHGKSIKKERSKKDVKKFLKASGQLAPKDSNSKEKIQDLPENDQKPWRRREFELMRHIERSASKTEKYIALGFSVVVFALVWVGGSLVFWAMEANDAHWTYPNSLYFSYTSILTIGYGDFFPTTAASRPFFVIWSLVAVPAVTVLVANMQETVLEGVKEGVVWVGSWTLLPEPIGRDDHKDHRERRVIDQEEKKRGEGETQRWSPRNRTKSTTSSQRPIRAFVVGKTERVGRDEVGFPATQPQSHLSQIEGGVQTEAEEVSRREEATQTYGGGQSSIQERGRSGERQQQQELALTIRLAREITRVAKDASQVPPVRYGWSEWVRWLKLMDEAGESLGVMPVAPTAAGRRRPPLGRLGKLAVSMEEEEERFEPEQARGHGHTARNVAEGENGGDERSVQSMVDVWKWTWLDDRGPLFSPETETEWVLNKLCLLLERVAEKGSE